ncbi:TIGR02117 family protein [Pontibacter anaerobius]|uniref:TIGR02117 family protein n=1 Tax=Pontibacter anaerobius TaxID=2993940 RepID=A0ABT3RIN3_9BACT|nr:TIGR02117 family protein [Pontibacter anaerobius]MCX2741686.1 TIGR02117 family protein [Pontibacter anaerobius]
MHYVLGKLSAFILWALVSVAGVAALFLAAAFILGSITVNSGYAQVQPQEEHIEIYVTSNGVHTDIIVPVSSPYIDWREKLPAHQFGNVDSTYRYIGFGWGDRKFYMETPEWTDLTPKVAITAALWPTRTAMHVEYIRNKLVPTRRQRPLRISPEQYRQLISYIDNSFVQQENGRYLHISNSGYAGQDTFYEANRKFYILKNCNNWVNQGLKSMGVKTAVWAPLPVSIMRHLR